jgi:hypothetical protein
VAAGFDRPSSYLETLGFAFAINLILEGIDGD